MDEEEKVGPCEGAQNWCHTESDGTVDIQRLYATDDAAVWAAEFKKVCPGVDEGLMIGWFANAIETCKDRAKARERAKCAAIFAGYQPPRYLLTTTVADKIRQQA